MTGVGGPCPACGETTVAGASFCEACGAELGDEAHGLPDAAGAPCVSCGAPADHQSDGYCLECGHKQPTARDDLHLVSGRIAGATHRGRRHHRNEDAMAFADAGDHLVMVICDGVSTTDSADRASQAAADAALATLVDQLSQGGDAEQALQEATATAQGAVLCISNGSAERANPSCTLVAVVASPGDGGGTAVTVGWLGDSRAYWLGETPEQLTRDHSVAAELVAAGEVSEAEARRHPRAASITRWIGADAVDPQAQVERFQFADQGRVLVCSDGLWSYAPDVAELRGRPELARPGRLDQAAGLVAFANESGGHDNITVVIGSLAPEPEAGSDPPRPS